MSDDKAYADVAPAAIGRMWAEMLKGMVEGGMTRAEALQVLQVYVVAVTQQPPKSRDDPKT